MLAPSGASLPTLLAALPRWRPGDTSVIVAVVPGLARAVTEGALRDAWEALTGPDGEAALLPVWAGGTPDDLPDELREADVLDADATLPAP